MAARSPRHWAQVLRDPKRLLVFCVLAICAALSIDVLSDPDMWWHLRLGQLILDTHSVPRGEPFSFTGPGSPFTAHEWLTDIAFALLRNLGGILLLAVAMGLVSLAAFTVIWKRARLRGAGPVVTACGLLLAAKAAQPVLGTRPQVISFALCGIVLLIADRGLAGQRRILVLLPPIFLLWANLHAGFVVGLAFLGVQLGAEVLRGWWRRAWLPSGPVLWLGCATLVGAAAACLNPQGPGIYRFALLTSAGERAKPIVEWQPPNFGDPGLWLLLGFLLSFLALTVLSVSRPALRSRLLARDVASSVMAAGLCLYAVRNTAIAVGVIAPLWMQMVQLNWPRAGSTRRPIPGVSWLLLAGTAAVLVITALRTVAAAAPSGVASVYPACAVTRLAAAPDPQRVFVTYGDAGYVIDRLWPKATVYEYGESISLGRTVFDNYLRIAADQVTAPSARDLLDSSGTTAALTTSSALVADLRGNGWTLVVYDGNSYLLARGTPPWATHAAPC